MLEEVKKLKQRLKGDILVSGSAQLVQTLLANDLVDQLNLAESRTVGDGVLILIYRPA